MTQHQWVWGILAVLVLSTSRVNAQDANLQNVESLRKQQQFEKALEILTAMDSRADLAADVKAVIPFEKALTLIASSKDQSNPELAQTTVKQAQTLLEQFLKANAGHPKAANASFELGMILKGRGVVSLQQARLPGNASKRTELIKQAKSELGQSKSMLTAASEKYSKIYESFGVYVDREKEPKKFEQWMAVEPLMLRAKLETAIVGFEEAGTFDHNDPQRLASLAATAAQFENLHARYRGQVIGVVARFYQGKCFEEQGGLQKALGIYNEVLSNKGDTEFMRNLQAQVMQVKLSCLNSAPAPDYKLVDQLAREWIKVNPDLINSKHAKGILLEQTRALEALSKDQGPSAQDYDARWLQGMAYVQGKDFEKAALEFEKIPRGTEKYWCAQFELGHALLMILTGLMAYQEVELPAPEGVQSGPAKIATLQKRVRDALEKAIAAVETEQGKDDLPTADVVTAKLNLALLANLQCEFSEAVRLLQTDHRSVISAIALPAGKARTATGIYSLSFTSDVYTQLIRAEIGMGDLPGACRTVLELEKLSADQGKDLPPAFVNFGKHFKPELDWLSQSNSQLCRQSLKRFEAYLSETLAQKSGQTFASLVWVGNVSSSLSDSVNDRATSSIFLGLGSQAYRVLLAKSVEEPAFCTKQQGRWCKMQLVRCQRQRGEFEAAVKLLAELLKERPDAVDAQTESAMLYQAWGATGTTFESDQKCSIAMLGDRAFAKNHAPMGMWGWVDLYEKVVKLPNAAEYQKELLEARYNIALYQLKTGLGQFGNKQNATFERAYQDVLATAKKNVLSPQEYQRFNLLFRRISLGTSRTVEDLPRNPNIPPPKPIDKSPDVKPETVE